VAEKAVQSRAILLRHYPNREADFFEPMTIGSSPASMDKGAHLILEGKKTLTSSAVWEWTEEVRPFPGALSVLFDGQGVARAILETTDVELRRAGEFNEELAYAYGEGGRTLAWWQREIGTYYRRLAKAGGHSFDEDTLLYLERFEIRRRL